VVNIEEGGEPYYPELDISQRDERKLRIRMQGNELSIWLDNEPVVEKLRTPGTPGHHLMLTGAVSNDVERFSRENLDDDVYDAVFINLTVVDGTGNEVYAYAAPEEQEEEENTAEEEILPEEKETFWEWLLSLVGLGRKAD